MSSFIKEYFKYKLPLIVNPLGRYSIMELLKYKSSLIVKFSGSFSIEVLIKSKYSLTIIFRLLSTSYSTLGSQVLNHLSIKVFFLCLKKF